MPCLEQIVSPWMDTGLLDSPTTAPAVPTQLRDQVLMSRVGGTSAVEVSGREEVEDRSPHQMSGEVIPLRTSGSLGLAPTVTRRLALLVGYSVSRSARYSVSSRGDRHG